MKWLLQVTNGALGVMVLVGASAGPVVAQVRETLTSPVPGADRLPPEAVASEPDTSAAQGGPPPDPIACPAGAFLEIEPNCGLDQTGFPFDFTNGGCNFVPERYSPIDLCGTVCGTVASTGLTRDTDWYEFFLPYEATIVFSARAAVFFDLFIMKGSCPASLIDLADFVIASQLFVPPFTTGYVSATLPPGIYRVVATPSLFVVTPCGAPYVATLAVVDVDTDLTLMPLDIDLRQDGIGPVTTKAKFDVWNMNEVRFSGTQRCITCWDQTLLSEYGFANHFLIQNLHTHKGKARIDGIASSGCPQPARASSLVGVAIKRIQFPTCRVARAAMSTPGTGTQAGRIEYDLIEPPESGSVAGEALVGGTPVGGQTLRLDQPLRLQEDEKGAIASAAGLADAVASISKKGSLLVFPKVELKWARRLEEDREGRVGAYELIQDTFIDLSNDLPENVEVQMYFVNGDEPLAAQYAGDPPILLERSHPGWNYVDAQIALTADQPLYWSVFSGQPVGVQPLSILDPGFPPGRPDMDPRNLGGRVLRGFVVAWAVNAAGEEINWNHLTGDVTMVNYRDGSAFEYNAWAFACVSGAPEGDWCDGTPGELDLNGREYDFGPDKLLLNFFAPGSPVLSFPVAGE